MSRSGYDGGDYDDNSISYVWESVVRRAKRGRRGQAFFVALVAALDALPKKELLAERIVCDDGCCAIGAMILDRPEAREMDPEESDHHEDLGGMVNIATSLVREVEDQNDECGKRDETPAERWTRMRGWAEMQILKEVTTDG